MKKYGYRVTLSWEYWKKFRGSDGTIVGRDNPFDWCVVNFGPGRKKSRWDMDHKDVDDGFETTFKFTDEKDYIHFMLKWS